MTHPAFAMSGVLPTAPTARPEIPPPVFRCAVFSCPRWAACNGFDGPDAGAPVIDRCAGPEAPARQRRS